MARILSGIFVIAVSVLMTGPISAEVPTPQVPKAIKGEQCVEPVDTMRRLHGEFLIHQRDETTRQGIRGKKYSLRGCVECHASPVADATGARSVEPFCASCHKYAAVKIDCFECHTTAPESRTRLSRRMAPKGHETLVAELWTYLDGRSPAP